ncbi:hypothetical protein GCM10007887_02350 [Methylobacterium haplocladii]|uniref:Uncharacterized protein n=1 Tax=Methylobacterium haplocladii TaxID=1176176 RepID=A0A512IJ97_9HYPH|nr:hypothetical protein MHA02_01750 [Methylobacterium haplocladii]GLS57580.1 hypothetical protein GCM10007887_02350 [Methylobacterium haplocladii]
MVKARSRLAASEPIESPGRIGETAPIAPLRRSTATRGGVSRQDAGRNRRKLSVIAVVLGIVAGVREAGWKHPA